MFREVQCSIGGLGKKAGSQRLPRSRPSRLPLQNRLGKREACIMEPAPIESKHDWGVRLRAMDWPIVQKYAREMQLGDDPMS